jgi:hypothetical protein
MERTSEPFGTGKDRDSMGSRRPGGRLRRRAHAGRTETVLPIAVVAFLAVAAATGLALWLLWAAVESSPSSLSVGGTVIGTIGPHSPVSSADKPFADFRVSVPDEGAYLVSVESDRPSAFEPFVVIRRNGNIVENSFASGELATTSTADVLIPGPYTIRVTRLRTGPLAKPAHFKLAMRKLSTGSDLRS